MPDSLPPQSTSRHVPDDRCLPGSARSSPLPRTVFSQPSPGASSSPLTTNCIRPLSVLTDFSSSSASVASCSSINRSHLDVDNQQSQPPLSNVACVGSYTHYLGNLTSRAAAVSPIPVGKSSHKGSDLQMDDTQSEITPPVERRTRSPFYKARKSCRPYTDHVSPCSVVCSSKDDRPQPIPVTPLCSVACSTPATRPVSQRCTVGVNTVFDRCKGTITEPDMLGPCEPGTTICLNGIVWLETTTGVLVVNVTWRGRTYIGTLLDATQHDFAPPCPRDYVPPFKSSVRSSNRTKRRIGVGTNYKQNCSSGLNPVECNGKPSTSSSTQRNRLRGRDANSPLSGTQPGNTPTTTRPPAPSTSADPLLSLRSITCLQDTTDPSRTGSHSRADEGENVDGSISDEEVTNGACVDRLGGIKDAKRGSSSSSSDCPSENLPDGVKKSGQPKVFRLKSSKQPLDATGNYHGNKNPAPTNGDAPTHSTVCDGSEGDAELSSSFPITCPLEGCNKRFTHVIALRFHLNHTRHDSSTIVEGETSSDNGSVDANLTSDKPTDHETNQNATSPPVISPPCSKSPASPSHPFTMPPPKPHQACHNLQHLNSAASEKKSDPSLGFHGCPGSDTIPTTSTTSGLISEFMPWSSVHSRDSHRPFFRTSSAGFTSGSMHDSTVIGSATRTVTAHTVSIPYGPTNKVDVFNGSTSRAGNTCTSTSKPRTPTTTRGDSNKVRYQSTSKHSSHSIKSDLHTNTTSRRLPGSLKDHVDYHNFITHASSSSALPPIVRSESSSGISSCAPQHVSNLALASRDFSNSHMPTGGNSLLSLPPGVWNFCSNSAGNVHSLSEPQSRSGGASCPLGELRHDLDGAHMNSVPLISSHIAPNVFPSSSALNLSSYIPTLSSMNLNVEHGHSAVNPSSSMRPASNQQPIDPSSFYGLPDFLMAAAMNAVLNTTMGNQTESLRPLASSQISTPGLPKLTPSLPALGLSPVQTTQATHFKPSNLSISSLSPVAPLAQSTVAATTAAPLSTMIGGNGPPLFPSSILQGFGLTPPFPPSVSTQCLNLDRLDPFRLSAAYFMQQQHAASAARFPTSGFNQQSS
ncbi:uncharacterized protein DEA37_0011720 [Paragonimus westermani]|uniref:C2H2-type domain-containing protein n=1 Tax=Paragonimus westermani TaxID=34504 RepID=A0A5J4P3X5_9TREM|nr:uncharacterized protein DEA37_0011720 [Paragonimus westermani]